MDNTMNLHHWKLTTDDSGIAWLHLDMADARANVLNRAVVEELDTVLAALENDPPRGLIICSDKPNGFIAGADIKEFTNLHSISDGIALVRRAQKVLDRLEAQTYPTLAMIHGFCLGGGLELALACRYRIAQDDTNTKLGLPEVKLGIHPGFGGTVRLPPLIGAPAAMDLILTGKALSARAAAKIGVIDHAVPQRQLKSAAWQMILKSPNTHKPTRLQALTNHRWVRPVLGQFIRNKLVAKANPDHYPAPYAALELWQHYADDPVRMMEQEAASVAELVLGNTAQSLIRVFFLQEGLKSLGTASDFKAQHVHVIGAGVMGGDIAAWCALQGCRVTLQDRKAETIAKVIQRAHNLFQKQLKDPRQITLTLDRLIPDIDGRGIEQADVVIEAIFENIEAKQTLFREIEPRLKPGALLATNTSSIPLETLAMALQQPERLVGLHFFNPVARMQLVEIVHGEQSGQRQLDQAAAFTKQINRLPLPVKSSPGFLVNRILMPYLLEAVTLVSEGVPAAAVDQAALEFGMPMGPIELADTVGLDICLSVAEILSQTLGGEVPEKLRERVAAGKLGSKSGSGFYHYKDGKPVKDKPAPDYRPPADLTARLSLRLINEAMACLREQVVTNGDQLDAGVIFGTGFAPFRGGPMHYAGQVGHQQLVRELTALAERHGERFRPDSGWSA